MIDYLVGEIGQKLSVRTAPEKGYIRRTTIRVPMDLEDFDDLFSGLSRGRRRFGVTAEDLDNLLPDGWSERAFRTTTRCAVSRQQPITIRFASQRKLHYDHSKCPRCQWSVIGEKPALCQARKTWPIDLSYLFVTFSSERSHQEQRKDGTLTNISRGYISRCISVLLHRLEFTFFSITIPWFILSSFISFACLFLSCFRTLIGGRMSHSSSGKAMVCLV